MSKASEWSEQATKLKFYESAGGCLGMVTTEGFLDLEKTYVSPKDALAFAHWIIDTFGETDHEKHARAYKTFQDRAE